jgi:hypothetical protein
MIAGPLLSGSVSETLGYYWMNTVLGEFPVVYVDVENISDLFSCPRIAHGDFVIFLDDGGAEERDGGRGLIGFSKRRNKKKRQKHKKNTQKTHKTKTIDKKLPRKSALAGGFGQCGLLEARHEYTINGTWLGAPGRARIVKFNIYRLLINNS